ncbi:Beta-1,4-galactosyltransferase [Photobacterium marinum]|uniref:Beta-1,4-galactosyltransferase n=1 Tax=Photobacterium marinum TaxID=1056511 RepID=L8JGG0_9GAMM|nr:glycosyltransferase family 25 protein [Photobacterium marinum]ELR67905.1 Beta-1,4-galactosyltransferase [Photobacterium marinum]
MKIFVVNLPSSVDRRECVEKSLSQLGVSFEIFEAVNGREGLGKDLEHYPNDNHRIWFRSRPLSPGERGCYASHFLLWRKCVELNEPIVVLEDDILPTTFFLDTLQKLPSLHSKGYEYIKLEPNANTHTPLESGDGFQLFFLHDNCTATRGYSLSPSGAKKLLDNSHEWLCSVDNFIGEAYRNKLVSTALLPNAIKGVEETEEFETTIQFGQKQKVSLIRKVTRELYRFYRFIRMTIWNNFTHKKYLP